MAQSDDDLLNSFLVKPAPTGAAPPGAPSALPAPASTDHHDDDEKLLASFLKAPAAGDPIGPWRKYLKPKDGDATAAGGDVPSLSADDIADQEAGDSTKMFDYYGSHPGALSEDLQSAGHAAKAMDTAAANGILYGFAPRLGALADSDPVGKWVGTASPSTPSYEEALAARNQDLAQARAEYPVASRAAEIGGGMLGATLPLGAVSGAIRGAPIAGRVLAGAGTGTAIGGLQGTSKSTDLTDVGQTAAKAAAGARSGAAFGALLPAAGGAIGAAYQNLGPLFGAGVPDDMSRMAAALMAGATSPTTGERLAALGPYGMLADTAPSMLGLTQGIATKGGSAADTVVNALSGRAAGQSDRLLGSLDDNLGPAFSPRQAEAMMADRQAAAGPMFNEALRNAPPVVDISPVTQQLENARLFAKGTDAARLDRFATLLQGPQRVNGIAQPEYDAIALHRSKMEMDAQIEGVANQTGSAAATATRDMVGVRAALNDALEQQVPGYADANLAYRTAARAGEAFDAGRQALKPGADTLWPADLEHQFGAMPLEQQAMMRSGARSDIAAGLGNNPNDLSALHKVVGGEADFNRAKMGTLFGPEQTANVVKDVGNERQFATTYNKVAEGTQTAQRLGNAANLDAAEAPPQYLIPKASSMTGLAGHLGEFLVRKGFGAMAQASGESTRDQLARALVAQGPQASSNLQALSRALLDRGQTAAAINNALASRAALVGALSGYREATRP